MSSDSKKSSPPCCPACQAELPRGAKFCWLCGNRVEGKQQAEAGTYSSDTAKASQSNAVLWILVALAIFGLARLGVTAPGLLTDPMVVSVAMPLVLLAVLIVMLLASSAKAAGRPWSAEKTAAATILGVLTAIGATLAVVAVVVLALIVALLTMCGQMLGGNAR